MSRWTAILIPLLVASLTTFAANAAASKIVAKLQGEHTNQNGVIRLTQQGGNVLVELRVNEPSGGKEPAGIRRGSCSKIDPHAFKPLNDVVNGVSTTTISGVSVAQLESGSFAVIVHASAADAGRFVSCGNVGRGATVTDDVDFNGFGGRNGQ
jgi:hypothetical protein